MNDAADTSCVNGTSSDQKYWIGLKLDGAGMRFTWSDDSDSLSVNNLLCAPFRNCPSFGQGQPCCYMHIESGGNRYLQMGPCTQTLGGYICEDPHETCKYCMYVLCLCLCRFLYMFVCMNMYVHGLYTGGFEWG